LVLWAKKIFKTKPTRTISADTKDKIKTIFHHLTKEELMEKVLAEHIGQQGALNINAETPLKGKK
jgi:ATP-dependent RNA helicase DeaD